MSEKIDDEDARIADQVAYYDALALDYPEAAQGSRAAHQVEKYASRALQDIDVSGDTCLELACGPGRWTALLAKGFNQVTAVDGSPAMLALARKKL